MGHHRLDNGDAFMRAVRAAQAAQRQAINQYNSPWTLQRAQATYQAYAQVAAQRQATSPYLSPMHNAQNPYVYEVYRGRMRAAEPPIAGMPEPEDTTGLRLLEAFLQKRRDGNKGE